MTGVPARLSHFIRHRRQLMVAAFLCTATTLVLLMSVRASAQELEPRAYSNAPVGLNFLVTGFSYVEGGIATDPAGPIENAQLFVLLGATLAGAAKIRSQHDPKFDFSKVKTYRFKVEKGHVNEDLDRRIRAEIRAQLTKKGLRELPAGEELADLLVTYAAGSVDHLVPGGWIVEYDFYGSLLAVPADLSTVTGGLLIEMGDPKSGKSVWAASYIMRGNNPQSLQVMIDRAEKAVRGALGKYPPR